MGNQKTSEPDFSNDFTICFNEATSSFTSFYGFTPSWYINQGDSLFTTGLTTGDIWRHHVAGSNSFYGGASISSAIEYSVRPPEGYDQVTFNNLTYNMEMKDQNGNDILNSTFETLKISNEYQTSNW